MLLKRKAIKLLYSPFVYQWQQHNLYIYSNQISDFHMVNWERNNLTSWKNVQIVILFIRHAINKKEKEGRKKKEKVKRKWKL